MRKLFLTYTVLSMILFLWTPVYANTTYTWTGGGSDNKLDTNANWDVGSFPTLPTTTVIFATHGSSASADSSSWQTANVVFNSSNDFSITPGGGTFGIGYITSSTDGIFAQNPDTTSDTSSRTYTISSPVKIEDSQTWTILNNGVNTTTLAVSGVISGIGSSSLTMAGTGTLELLAKNTYTGGTTVNGGTLIINNASNNGYSDIGTGTLTINSGAIVVTAGDHNPFGYGVGVPNNIVINGGTLSTGNHYIWMDNVTMTGGTISGSGKLTMGSSSNANTFTIDASSTNSVISVPEIQILAATTINTASNASLTLSSTLYYSGSLTKTGAGTLTLSGANNVTGGDTSAPFTGAVNINEGALQVSNAHALGSGIVSVANSGTLAIGTTNLSLGSAYTQNLGSTLAFTANSASNYGYITVTGAAATLNSGSLVNITLGNNYYVQTGTIFTVINGGSGSSYTLGTDKITSSDSRITFTPQTSGNNLILTANRPAWISPLGGNPNAKTAGSIFDNITNPSSGMATVLNAIDGLSNAQVTSTLNTVTPIIDAGVRENTAAALNNFVGASIDRAQNVLNLASAGNSNTSGVSAGDQSKLNGIWAKEYGSYLNQGTDQGIPGYNAWNTGTAVGFDHLFGDTLTVGVSGGYAYGSVTSAANYRAH